MFYCLISDSLSHLLSLVFVRQFSTVVQVKILFYSILFPVLCLKELPQRRRSLGNRARGFVALWSLHQSISLSFPSSPCTTPTSCLAAFPRAWFVLFCLSKHLGEGAKERWEKDEKRRSGGRPQGPERRQQGERLKNVERWDRGRLADRHGAGRWWGADKWPSNDLRLTG